jgi:hypothetical protein
MTPSQKGQETRKYNEHRRNLKIERAIDDHGVELISTVDFLRETNWRCNSQQADLMLSTWAGCFTKWIGKPIQYSECGDRDWDFGHKMFPRNLLVACTIIFDAA